MSDERIARLKERWGIAETFYARPRLKMKLLDAVDNGDLWKALQAKFPGYQLMPDSNWVSYIKANILSSLYTITKSPDLIPNGEEDREICLQLSVILEHVWDIDEVGYYQFLAGERAALLNLGLTYAYWDTRNKKVKFRNIDPMKFARDPYAANLSESGWCVMWDSFHKSVILDNPRYAENFRNFLKDNTPTEQSTAPDYPDRPPSDPNPPRDHHTIYIWFVKEDGKYKEYHLLNNDYILYENEDMQPAMFPIAELYCNCPGTKLLGASEPSKIFANNMVYNLMNSIAFTAEYKNQRPPKFVSSQSGLNIKAFAKHGDEADRTFIVNGDATRAVHFQEFPKISPGLPMMLENLQRDIQDTSGVDQKYTGRNTGSIQTTGGTEQLLNRATLIDSPKIIGYEKYTRDLAKIVLSYLIQFSPERTFFVKDARGMTGETKWIPVTVDFPRIKAQDAKKQIIQAYYIQISSEMPKNKQRLAGWADMMLEKQMQYQQQGTNVEFISVEEWIMHQDTPYKEQMLKRMGIQRQFDTLEQVSQTLSEFQEMTKAGIPVADATVMAAQGLDATKQGAATPWEAAKQQNNPLAGLGPASPMGGGMPNF